MTSENPNGNGRLSGLRLPESLPEELRATRARYIVVRLSEYELDLLMEGAYVDKVQLMAWDEGTYRLYVKRSSDGKVADQIASEVFGG